MENEEIKWNVVPNEIEGCEFFIYNKMIIYDFKLGRKENKKHAFRYEYMYVY